MEERKLGEFVIRHATQRDFTKLTTFFEENLHSNNAQRQDDVLLARTRERSIFLIENAGDRRIHGIGGLFPLLDGDYQEFGYTRIKLGGFGLQNYLIAIRHVHSRVLDGPNAVLFATVQAGADRSRDNLLLQGFEPWPSPDSKLVHHKAEMARAKGKAPSQAEYLKLSVDKLRKHAEFVLDEAALHKIRRVNSKDGSQEYIRLRLSVEIVNPDYYLQDTRMLAEGKL